MTEIRPEAWLLRHLLPIQGAPCDRRTPSGPRGLPRYRSCPSAWHRCLGPVATFAQLSTGGHRTQWLPGPAPRDGRKIPGGWWLTLMPGPAWIRDDQARFEVIHVHFVFDSLSSEQLGQVVDTL